jgi:hypothetical protein
MPAYCVVLFPSASYAIRAETVLQKAGIRGKMIPTPRQLSTDCGVALRFDRAERDRVVAVLAEKQLAIEGVHDL